jgi:N-acetylglucosamine-6-phosphate deacetylase
VIVRGRLVLDDRVEPGVLEVEDGVIRSVEPDRSGAEGPYIAPGFVDVHVHGWGGHSAMGGRDALDGMARALLRRGVTSFLPSGWSEPLPVLEAFTDRVRDWMPNAPEDGAEPLGPFLEGPFLSHPKKGAHDPRHLLVPADVPLERLEPLLPGLRMITIAPELPGALDLIRALVARGVRVALGHSAATLEEAEAGYAAGATTTTHLFNGMSGVEHRAPGLAVAALVDDAVHVELIGDGAHVHRGLWPLIRRLKPPDRLLLISDAVSLAGSGVDRGVVGAMEIEIVDGRGVLAGTGTLAGSVIALDSAVRNMVGVGAPIPAAVAAASRNPLRMLGVTDRGRLAVGQRAHLVELDDDLRVRRVTRGDGWIEGAD